MRFLTDLRTYSAAVLAGYSLVSPQTSKAQATINYVGEAAIAKVDVLLLNVPVADTGVLPIYGGYLSAQLPNINLPGVLSASLLDASTTGGNDQTSSQASTSGLNLTAAGIKIKGSVLTSNATATACNGSAPMVNGGSTITGLTVNGTPINVTGAPNQKVPLLVGSLILNEQISSITSSATIQSGDLVVNALHLSVLGAADVIIAYSHAGVNCSY